MRKPAHYLARQETLKRSKKLRSSMTDEERLLWSELKHFREAGFAFRKQAAIGPFIADFLCRKAMLVVEVDGRHHDTASQLSHDQERDEWLKSQGYTVLRFSARETWSDLDSVVTGIENCLKRTDIIGSCPSKSAPSDLAIGSATSPIEGEE